MELYEIKRIIKNKGGAIFKIAKKIYKPIKNILEIQIKQQQYNNLCNQLNNISKEEKKIIYVGIPLHSNLGDQAQYYCIKRWIKDNYPGMNIIEIPDCIIDSGYKRTHKLLLNYINKEDYIIFQSGYRTTDVANIVGEHTHRKIVTMFPENKILVFPQTINFEKEEELEGTKKAYAKGKKVLFLARDEKSYKIANEIYLNNKIELYPDIVTSLIGQYKFHNNREGILCCTRRDNEKLYENKDIEKMMENLSKIAKVDRNDTSIDIKYDQLKPKLEKILEDTFNEFSKYKVIITDRYHGTIFGLISETPTIVLSSTDHKLSSGVNWFKKDSAFDKYIYYAETLEDAEKLANKIYQDKTYNYNLPKFFKEQYYDKLKDIFENI